MSDISPITTKDGFSVKELEKEDPSVLYTKDILPKIRELIGELVIAEEPGETEQFSKILLAKVSVIPRTKETLPIVAQYTAIAHSVKFIHLLALSDEDIEQLFQYYFVSALALGIEIRYFASVLFNVIGIEEDVAAMQNRIVNALSKNTEVVGQKKIDIGRESVSPQIRYWLTDYDMLFEGEKGPLQEVEYFNKSRNAGTLLPQEKELVHKALLAYDFIKYPSEQEIPDKFGMSSEGEPSASRPELTAQKAKKPDDKEYIVLFNTLPLPMEEVQSKMRDILSRKDEHPNLVFQILANPEKVRDKAFVLAALLLRLPDLKSQISNKDKVKAYIRDMLEIKLGWSEQDSAKFGIRVGKILGEGYRDIAYYNKTAGKFEWAV